jgi:hypothetical protein
LVEIDIAERVGLDLRAVTLRAAASAPVLRFIIEEARELTAGVVAR